MSVKKSSITSKKEHLNLTEKQFRDANIFDSKIVNIENLSPSVKGLTLNVIKTSTTPLFKAGQWVDFFIPGVSQVGGYSMYSTPKLLDMENQIKLAVKCSEWAPAKWIHEQAGVGHSVKLRFGGDFHYPNAMSEKIGNHNLLLIAGGIGINPIYSILQHFCDDQVKNKLPQSRVELLYSAKSEEELVFKDDISRLYTDERLFRSKYFVTGVPTENDTNVANRRMAENDIEQCINVLQKENTLVYICGPKTLIEDSNTILVDHLKVPKDQVFYELWY